MSDSRSQFTYTLGFLEATVQPGLPAEVVKEGADSLTATLLTIPTFQRVKINDDGSVTVWRPMDLSDHWTWSEGEITALKRAFLLTFWRHYNASPASKLIVRKGANGLVIHATFPLTEKGQDQTFLFPIRENDYLRGADAAVQRMLLLFGGIAGVVLSHIGRYRTELNFAREFLVDYDAVITALELAYPGVEVVDQRNQY